MKIADFACKTAKKCFSRFAHIMSYLHIFALLISIKFESFHSNIRKLNTPSREDRKLDIADRKLYQITTRECSYPLQHTDSLCILSKATVVVLNHK